MTDKFQLVMAALTVIGFGALGALLPLPAFATDNAHPSLPTALMGRGVSPQPERAQIADSVQSAGSSSSASSSASSSVTVTGGKKRGKCTAEATANAQANGIKDSDHDLKVVEGDGCSAKAESSATVKPQQKQQTE